MKPRLLVLLALAVLVGLGTAIYVYNSPPDPDLTVEKYLKAVKANDTATLDKVCTPEFRPNAVRPWMKQFIFSFVSGEQHSTTSADVPVRFIVDGKPFPAHVLLVRNWSMNWRISGLKDVPN